EVSVMERYHAHAESGDSLAQLRLAEVYSRDPAAKDKLSICMWLVLAETIASAVKESARAARAKSEASLDAEEIRELKARVRRWLDLHTDKLGHLVNGFEGGRLQLTTPSDANGEARGERQAVRSSRALRDTE